MNLTQTEYVDRLQANVPFDLKSRDQWVLYRLVPKPNGKMDKVPYSARTGEKADSTDAGTWAPFDDACEVYRTGFGDGLGYVFSADDPYSGIDFDACVAAGHIDAAKWAYVHRLNSYSEYSPSETGIHTIVAAQLPAGGRKSAKHGVEMYDRARFFTFTGHHVDGTPHTIEQRQAELVALHVEIFGKPLSEREQATQRPPANIPTDDKELLDLMLGGSAGDKIQRLWDGDTSAHAGDDSGADLALCNYLAFYTNGDVERIDRLFRQSRLMRPKWDREDYGCSGVALSLIHI